jgi:hypothetical protein
MEDVSLIVDYKNAAVTAEDSTQVYNSVEPKIVESYALLEKITIGLVFQLCKILHTIRG